MSPVASSLVTLVVVLALSLATGYPTNKDEEAYYYNRLHDFPDNYNKDVRNLDGIGGGNLLRDLDMLRNRAAFFSRGNRDSGPEERKRDHSLDTTKGQTLGGSKRNVRGCCDIFGGAPIGNQKRNMDEIDRSSFNSFIKKNFDEIDRSGFGSFVKRNFDEIDHSRFGQFVKRSAPAVPEQN